jgi:glycerol-3-phosphate acyltransferase PlsY
MLTTYLTVALVAYLLGSIPFGYILVKIFLKQDIRTTGSGNIGATNVARSGKKGLAIATLLLDAGKGFFAVAAAHFDNFSSMLDWAMRNADTAPGTHHPWSPTPAVVANSMVLAALFAIIGHCFPIWLKFRGGKGVATAVGAFLGVSALAVLISLAVFAVVFATTKYVSLSSIVATAFFPIAVVLLDRESATVVLVTIVLLCSLIIILKHHSNIRRLLNGTEPKFGQKKSLPADPIQVEKNA